MKNLIIKKTLNQIHNLALGDTYIITFNKLEKTRNKGFSNGKCRHYKTERKKKSDKKELPNGSRG